MRQDSISGLSVHIAARIAALASASNVVVSRTVKDLVGGSGISFDDLGDHALKGVPDPWRLYQVVSPGQP
jgi:class 3 adenylate cyclase